MTSALTKSILGLGLAVALVQNAQAAPPPLTDDVRPTRASGVGLNVADIERSKDFYTQVLGFKIAARYPAEGPALEYLLGMTGNRMTDTLVVLTAHAPQPGAQSFGRVILVVPSGRKMAERVAAAGYPPERIVDGTNMVKDPDGYMIELYQRPTPPPSGQ
jgi:catechol 2,3-dioxygenase-like lactoylglutathione lyase family enzyme